MTKQEAKLVAIDTQEALRLLDDMRLAMGRVCVNGPPDAVIAYDKLRVLLSAKGADSFDVRLWDSQWINAVNHDNAYRDWSKEDAINHAVRMTEEYMRKNVTEWKWPPSREDSAFVELENCAPPLRDAEKEKAMGEWQPIETAPKDGRTLLLGRFNRAGKWRTMRGQWMSEDYIYEYWEDPERGEAGWFEDAVEAEETPNCWPIEPTHWMPLPEPPQ